MYDFMNPTIAVNKHTYIHTYPFFNGDISDVWTNIFLQFHIKNLATVPVCKVVQRKETVYFRFKMKATFNTLEGRANPYLGYPPELKGKLNPIACFFFATIQVENTLVDLIQ